MKRPTRALALSAVCIVALAGCGMAPVKPEVRTVTNTVYVPTPTPCFKPEDVPKIPTPTPVDTANATLDQINAAAALDLQLLDAYAKQVDALFVQCTKSSEVKP